MTQLTALIARTAVLTAEALRLQNAGREARDNGYDDEANECFIDAADLAQRAGELAGLNGLEMPAMLDGEHALVDLFQDAAVTAWEASHAVH